MLLYTFYRPLQLFFNKIQFYWVYQSLLSSSNVYGLTFSSQILSRMRLKSLARPSPTAPSKRNMRYVCQSSIPWVKLCPVTALAFRAKTSQPLVFLNMAIALHSAEHLCECFTIKCHFHSIYCYPLCFGLTRILKQFYA